VKNICKYNPRILELNKELIPSELEGEECKAIYNFKIKKKTDTLIEFIEDYSDYKISLFYIYDSENNIVSYYEITNGENSIYNKIKKKNSISCVLS
jgi:hypothetical protein